MILICGSFGKSNYSAAGRSERPAWLSRADCLHATLLSAEEHRRDTALADVND